MYTRIKTKLLLFFTKFSKRLNFDFLTTILTMEGNVI